MSERRCPRCGGLVGPDVAWCGQCLARLDERPPAPASVGGNGDRVVRGGPDEHPTPRAGTPSTAGASTTAPRPPVAAPTAIAGADASDAAATGSRPGGEPPIRASEAGLRWTCKTCDMENDLDAKTCVRCGARFMDLFADPEPERRVEPSRAVRLSLLLPGAGHMAAGRVAEGVARAVVFLWAVGSMLAITMMRSGQGAGPFLPILLLLAVASSAIYWLTAVDARRLAESRAPLLSSRVLLYGVSALILLVVFLFSTVGMKAPTP